MLVTKLGFEVSDATSAAKALELLEEHGTQSFGAVVTDYRMPERNGLELLQDIKKLDITLSVVILTAQGDKEAVANFLKHGANGFLDKPASSNDFSIVLEKAMKATTSLRGLRHAATEAKQVGYAQRLLLGQNIAGLSDRCKITFRPFGQAGGDFVSAYPIDASRSLVMVSDISGHDLQAAYQSSYLQGFTRALFSSGFDLEESMRRLNSLIVNEWNNASPDILSLATCAVCVDRKNAFLSLINCGLPPPVIADPFGWAKELDTITGPPLGWWAEVPRPSIHPIQGGRLVFWSDGLEDLADKISASPLSLCYRLSQPQAYAEELFKLANDDIIAVQLDLSSSQEAPFSSYCPLLAEHYKGSEADKIDDILSFLERSLRLALPLAKKDHLHDLLICTREAAINGFKHGCQNSPDKQVSIKVALSPKKDDLVVQIVDTGPGHCFHLDQQKEKISRSLVAEHHGLAMISNFSREMIISPTGNSITMHFHLS